MSRLTIEIDPQEHRMIKTLATFSGLTIKEYILSKALPAKYAKYSKKEDTTKKLLSSPKNAARLRKALATPKSRHLVFESLEELENALGI